MPSFFDIKNIAFEALGVKMSFLELWATISGAVAVLLSARENVWSWVIGLLNVCLAFIMFYQIQLYPDMFLQVFFFITNIIGFWLWKYPKENEANNINELKITNLPLKFILIISLIGILGTIIMGSFSKNLNEFFPKLFSLPSAFPYMDSFTTIMSVVATFLLMKKKLEAWWLWLVIDVISTYMYFIKDVKLYSLLYLIFCAIAVYGAIDWTKKWRIG